MQPVMGCAFSRKKTEKAAEDSSTTLPLGTPLQEQTPSPPVPVRRLSKAEVRESRFSLAKSESTERFRLKKEQEQTTVVASPIQQPEAGVANTTSVGFDIASREFTKDRPERRSRRNLHADMTA